MKKWWGRVKAYIRVWLGITFIRCETPYDILIIRRYGTIQDWEYTLEQLSGIVAPCEHSHSVLFADAEYFEPDLKETDINIDTL